jgi:hypothetical protein
MADEDDEVHAQELDEDREPGSDGEATDGADGSGRDDESDLSTQRAGADEDEGPSPERGAPQPEAQSRGSRVQRLANENREYRERLERLERERENDRRQWERQQQQFQEAQERDRLNLMTPEERSSYYRERDRQELRNELQQNRMQSAIQMDKIAYDAKASTHPVYRRMQQQVEDMFQEQLRKGQPTDRETILYHLLGRQSVQQAAAGSNKSRQQARRRVDNQRVAPSSGKGEARHTERRLSTAEERLKDVLI